MYYRTCPYCGANLDPGEKCDCAESTGSAAGAGNSGTGAGPGKAGHTGNGTGAAVHYNQHRRLSALCGNADGRKGQRGSTAGKWDTT